MKKDADIEAFQDLIGRMDGLINQGYEKRKKKPAPQPELADGQSDSEEI